MKPTRRWLLFIVASLLAFWANNSSLVLAQSTPQLVRKQLAEFRFVTKIAIDPESGNLYVADSVSQLMVCVTSEGEELWRVPETYSFALNLAERYVLLARSNKQGVLVRDLDSSATLDTFHAEFVRFGSEVVTAFSAGSALDEPPAAEIRQTEMASTPSTCRLESVRIITPSPSGSMAIHSDLKGSKDSWTVSAFACPDAELRWRDQYIAPPLRQVHFSQDDRSVALLHGWAPGSESYREAPAYFIRWYDTISGELLYHYGSSEAVGAICFSPDGKGIYAAMGRDVHLLEIKADQETQRIHMGESSLPYISALHASREGVIALGDSKGGIEVLEIEDQSHSSLRTSAALTSGDEALVQHLVTIPEGPIRGLCSSPAGLVQGITESNTVFVWDPRLRGLITTWGARKSRGIYSDSGATTIVLFHSDEVLVASDLDRFKMIWKHSDQKSELAST